MFTANDLVVNDAIERPYQPLTDGVAAFDKSSESPESKCCSCSDACQCIAVNAHAGAVLGTWLVGVTGGMLGACCIGPSLVLLDFCCFPPKENHDCWGNTCKVCGIAAAIPGIPAASVGAIACGTAGLATGLLCAPIAFFGGKPKCYNEANAGLHTIMKDVYDEISGNKPAPVSQVMR